MLGMPRFRHGCMRPTGESTRTSIISPVRHRTVFSSVREARTVRVCLADSPRVLCSSRVHRVLAHLRFRSGFVLGFCCSRFADDPSFSSGRSRPGADSPFFPVRLWWFCWLLRTVRSFWPDCPQLLAGLSEAPGRTVRVASADRPPLLAGQAASAWQLCSLVRLLSLFFRASVCASRNRS
jgi:hypothetical protein